MNKPNINKKVLTAIFAVLFIGMIAGSSITYALTPTQTFSIYGGIYPGAPSYTIFEDGSGSYFAKNALGVVVWSSTDAKTVFTNVIANGNNSIINISPGTYYINAEYGVYFYNIENCSVYGYGATIKNGYSGEQIQLWDVRGNNLYFYGLTFDQDRNNPAHLMKAALGAQWTVRVGYCDNVVFKDCKMINGLEENIVTGNTKNVWFQNCLIDTAGEHSIYISEGTVNVNFEDCVIKNWAIGHRGYTKVTFSTGVKFSNCVFDMTADGHTPSSVPDGSYEMVISGKANETLIENCQFYNPWNQIWVDSNCWNTRIINNNFTRVRADNQLVIEDTGNFTKISGNAFYGFSWRLVDAHISSDALIENNYFSGGASSLTIWFGFRTSVIGNYWVPNTATGSYALGSAGGTGLFAFNHVCNSTLVFTIPAGVQTYANMYY